MLRIANATHALKALWLSVSLLLVLICAGAALAQTTSFTYQGRLTDGGTAANGNYDLQFTLWDTLSAGTQQPQPAPVTVMRTSVLVTGGIFTVQLDFGASAFPGADRFLEIGARLSGGGAFTILSPRQPISSTPYAIRSLNASTADAVIVNGVPGGSGNYIQNAATPQATANFNISGNGTAGGTLRGNIVNATTQYNLFGQRILSAPFSENVFVGRDAGAANTDGYQNDFFGNTTGQANTIGGNNSFFGHGAGFVSTNGDQNAFFGAYAGSNNVAGSNNTAVGAYANVGSGSLTNANAIGWNARVDQSNSLVLGSVAGVNFATTSVNVGIGTTTPQATLDIRVNQAMIRFSGVNCGPNFGAITFGNVALGCSNYSLLGEGVNTFINRPSGGALLFRENNNDQMVIQSGGNVVINGRGEFGGLLKLDQIDSGLGAGTTQLCRNAAGVIATCTSSSLRYKKEIAPFSGGLSLIRRLRPISFTWKMDGSRDVGLGAEDVAKVEPLLVTHNDKGEIEGVRYDRLNIVLLNAIKQQQEQIASQQQQITNLKRLVCLNHRRSSICK